MSAGVAVVPTPSLSLMSPLAASSWRARPSLTVSLGTATVAPLFRSAALSTLWEYRPRGSRCTSTTDTMWVPRFLLKSSRYGVVWKKLASTEPSSVEVFGVT